MQPFEKFKFDLPIDVIAMIDEAVAAGKYLSRDDMFCALLSEWQQGREIFGEEFLNLWQKCADKELSAEESFNWMTSIAKSCVKPQSA